MTTPDIVHSTVHHVDVPFGPGAPVLRVALATDADGAPLVLQLAQGWGEGSAWVETPGSRVSLPGTMLDAFIDALEGLRAA